MCYSAIVVTASCSDNENHPHEAQICWRQCAEHAQLCAVTNIWNTRCEKTQADGYEKIYSDKRARIAVDQCFTCQEFLRGPVLECTRHIAQMEQRIRQLEGEKLQYPGDLRTIQIELDETRKAVIQRMRHFARLKIEIEIKNERTLFDAAINKFTRPDRFDLYYYGNQSYEDREDRTDAPRNFPPAYVLAQCEYSMVPFNLWIGQ